MSKMTIIQLLNKIANGEDVPKKIKYKNTLDINQIFVYDQSYNDYVYKYKNKKNRTETMFIHYLSTLNDEIEILEEPKGIPEKLDINLGIAKMTPTEKYISNTVNEILDYLESKEDE